MAAHIMLLAHVPGGVAPPRRRRDRALLRPGAAAVGGPGMAGAAAAGSPDRAGPPSVAWTVWPLTAHRPRSLLLAAVWGTVAGRALHVVGPAGLALAGAALLPLAGYLYPQRYRVDSRGVRVGRTFRAWSAFSGWRQDVDAVVLGSRLRGHASLLLHLPEAPARGAGDGRAVGGAAAGLLRHALGEPSPRSRPSPGGDPLRPHGDVGRPGQAREAAGAQTDVDGGGGEGTAARAVSPWAGTAPSGPGPAARRR